MIHPTLAELLVADDQLAPDVATHLGECAICGRLRDLRRPAATAVATGEGELGELPIIEPTHYAIHEELRDGTGGMGRTLRARDRRLGRTVAIKQPLGNRDPLLAELLRERFLTEARLTARLEHPAIITVYEAGRWPDGKPFYAMRLVRGAPLTRLIEQRDSLVERLALVGEVIKIGEALAYAHSQGVLHRDVKPDNILVGPYGQTVLIDWGLARDRGEPAGEAPRVATPTGVTALGIGTPHYMPPEQAAGNEPDERVDIYAVGATLYHVLAGVPPYTGDGAEARAAVLVGDPPPLAERAIGAPPSLVACVARAMARDPAARFATMGELVEELHRFQRGEMLQSYRYGWLDRAALWARRHRALLGVVALALVVVVAVIVQSVRHIIDERDARALAQERAEIAFADSRGQAASLLAAHTATRGDALVAALDGMAGHPDGDRTRQGLVDALAAGLPTRELDAHAGGELLVVAAGDRLAIIGIDRTLRVWRRDGTPIAEIALPLERTHALVASGGHVLACGWKTEAAWVDLEPRTVTVLHAPSKITACAATTSGRPITAGAGEIVRWSPSGTVEATLAVDAPVDTLATDGDTVFATTGAGDLWRWTAAGAQHGHGHGGTTYGLLVTPDRVLTAGFDGRVVRWKLGGDAPQVEAVLYEEPGASLGQLVELDEDHLGVLSQSSLSARILARDGERYRLVWRAPARVIRDHRGRVLSTVEAGLVEVSPSTGATIRVMGEHESGATTITAVGDRLVTGTKSGAAVLWDLSAGDAWPSHRGEVTALATGPDGLFASAGLDGRVLIHRADDHRVVFAGGVDLIALKWAARAPRLVVLDGEGAATVIDPAVARPLARIANGPALDIAITADGGKVAIAGVGGVEIWPVAGGEPLRLANSAGATTVTFAGDDVITGHAGGVVKRWSKTGELSATRTLDDRPTTGIRSLFVDGDDLRVALRDHTVDLDPITLTVRASWPVEWIAPAGAGRWIGGHGASLQLVPARGVPQPLGRHRAVVTAAAADGDRIATGDVAGVVEVWDDGRAVEIAPGSSPEPAPAITALALISNAVVIGDARGALRVVPIERGAATAAACARLDRIGRRAESAHCP